MKFVYSLKHIRTLTDTVGIIEHAKVAVPNLDEGYSVDDNARALLVCSKIPGTEKLAAIYLNFLLSAMDEKGFHQDLNPDGTWKDDAGIHEGFGRAMQALAATPHFDKLAHLISKVTFPRVIAQLIMALAKRKSLDLTTLADKLVDLFEKHSDVSWKWYEDSLTYENARLPLALFTAYEMTQNSKYLKVARESLDFLINQSYDSNRKCFSFVGHVGWHSKNGGAKSLYGQQPVEAGGMVEVCVQAFKSTKSKKYLDYARDAVAWYSGKNLLGLSLIDKKSGGIKDGLEEYGVNQNEGAESILSYILACQALNNLES